MTFKAENYEVSVEPDAMRHVRIKRPATVSIRIPQYWMLSNNRLETATETRINLGHFADHRLIGEISISVLLPLPSEKAICEIRRSAKDFGAVGYRIWGAPVVPVPREPFAYFFLHLADGSFQDQAVQYSCVALGDLEKTILIRLIGVAVSISQDCWFRNQAAFASIIDDFSSSNRGNNQGDLPHQSSQVPEIDSRNPKT